MVGIVAFLQCTDRTVSHTLAAIGAEGLGKAVRLCRADGRPGAGANQIPDMHALHLIAHLHAAHALDAAVFKAQNGRGIIDGGRAQLFLIRRAEQIIVVGELLQLCLAHAALLSLCKLGVESLRLTAEGIYLAVVGVELGVLLRAGERFLLKVGNDRCAVVEECAVFLLGNGEPEQCVLLSRTIQRELAVFDDGTVDCGRAIAVYVHYIYLTNTCLADAFNAILRTRN